MKILSLFDGMACGMIAMLNAGIEVESYDAYEIDKYAIKVSTHNFPMIKQHGDVFKADFTQYEGVDYLIGGSPCTYWSIAQKNNRETEASGMGWELFNQYVRALLEAQPKYFIYENNKSMTNAIRESITKTFGFDPVCINSALVSAQNRKRLYWVGKRNADGTYSQVHVDQPEDKHIVLRDVLDCGTDYEARKDGKTNTLPTVQKDNYVCEPVRVGTMPRSDGVMIDHQQSRIYNIHGKSTNLNANGGGQGAKTGLYAIPVKEDNVLSDEYWHGGFDGPLIGMVETPMTGRNGKQPSQHCRVYSCEDKFVCLGTDARNRVIAPYEWYAVAVERDESGNPTKAKSFADGKISPVYEVRGGQITIKGERYPIKLSDGFYIIRNLTISECKRLQTVPEWYDFSVISNSQAYKCLGNGWTCKVITHLIEATKKVARRKWLDELLGGGS